MADLNNMKEFLIAKCKEEIARKKQLENNQPKAKIQKIEKKETKVSIPFVFKKK